MNKPSRFKARYTKSQRIRTSESIFRITRNGKRFRYSGLGLYIDANSLSIKDKSMFAVVCAKRYLKKAVHRNRFKRAARDVFRERQYAFDKPLKVIIRLECQPDECIYSYFYNQITILFQKSGVLSD